MKQFQFTIRDELGIHARPAGQIVKAASGFASNIKIASESKNADAKRIMAVMQLGVKKGNTVTVTCEGPDEDIAAQVLQEFFEDNM